MLQLTFLGSGSAFCLNNYQSNMLIEHKGKRLLIDCGSDIRFSLGNVHLSMTDIDAIYITHPHADHIGGLEGLAFMNYFTKIKKGLEKPKLFGDAVLLKDLWENSLKGGLDSLQTIDAELDTYFDVNGIQSNGGFDYAGVSYKLIQTIHVLAGRRFVRSFGLFFITPNKKKVFISSDTQFSPYQIRDFILSADIVFHDCETTKFPSYVHAHYNDLNTLPPEMKAKMWLYHYGDGNLPNAVADGFAGFVEKGQRFEF